MGGDWREHDLRLPAWGPYTKKYAGVSHIADAGAGVRFDLAAFPGFYRRRVDVPNVMWESGYHPWEASPDLTYFANRHELQWKDGVYTDISFTAVSDTARLVRAECVNNTDVPQTLALHLVASLHFPPVRPYTTEAIHPATVSLPLGGVWVDALDYARLDLDRPRPMDALAPDGLRVREVRGDGFTGGSGLGDGFGGSIGDAVEYIVTLPEPVKNAALVLRYRVASGVTAALHTSGILRARHVLVGTGAFATIMRPVGDDLDAGTHRLRFTAYTDAPVELDGFALVPADRAGEVTFTEAVWNHYPQIVPGPTPTSILLRYAHCDHQYGIAWDWPAANAEVREYRCDDLDAVMRHTVHHHTRTVFEGSGDGHYTDVFLRPLVLAAGETRAVDALVCAGNERDVRETLAAFPGDPTTRDAAHAAARARAVAFAPNPGGEAYAFGQERMAATLLTNVVYPIYCRGGYIRHHTPGRWWDSLYTWDSGFIGLGLAELDTARAADVLRAYLTPPGDPHSAFIHHGSPVPVQVYLCHDLWNRTRDSDVLHFCYPRLRQLYRFLAGDDPKSGTHKSSGLLQTWDHFYNSGGWDDYPPQVHVHAEGLEPFVTPAITTAHVIRIARILRMMADALDLPDDIAAYDRDITRFADALQRHAWDDEAGYFSYVRHDAAGNAGGILRHASGANFNRGLDGVTPLIAGICTPAQEERLVGHLFDPARLWTPIGITAVDQSAPYYRADGYWNGTVWMPHQWFLWKTLLDLGRPEQAARIARTALDLWWAETDETYGCFEHFVVASGRGAGWHQFGGLSAPVLPWFAAYHLPGRLTGGFDLWVRDARWADDRRALSADLALHGPTARPMSLVATLAPGPRYAATWQGEPVPLRAQEGGTVTLDLPRDAAGGVLKIGPE